MILTARHGGHSANPNVRHNTQNEPRSIAKENRVGECGIVSLLECHCILTTGHFPRIQFCCKYEREIVIETKAYEAQFKN
jgi:hypothetical protein